MSALCHLYGWFCLYRGDDPDVFKASVPRNSFTFRKPTAERRRIKIQSNSILLRLVRPPQVFTTVDVFKKKKKKDDGIPTRQR